MCLTGAAGGEPAVGELDDPGLDAERVDGGEGLFAKAGEEMGFEHSPDISSYYLFPREIAYKEAGKYFAFDLSKVDLNEIAYQNETMSKSNPVGIGQMLYHFGARINVNFIQDVQCAVIPVDVSTPDSEEPSWNLVPYVYFPLVTLGSSVEL